MTDKNKPALNLVWRILKRMIDYRLDQLPGNQEQRVRDFALGNKGITIAALVFSGALFLALIFFVLH